LVAVAVEDVVRQVQQVHLVVEVLDVEPIDQELQELQVKVTVEEKVDGSIIHQAKVMVVAVVVHL
jgi:hypothetical protein